MKKCRNFKQEWTCAKFQLWCQEFDEWWLVICMLHDLFHFATHCLLSVHSSLVQCKVENQFKDEFSAQTKCYLFNVSWNIWGNIPMQAMFCKWNILWCYQWARHANPYISSTSRVLECFNISTQLCLQACVVETFWLSYPIYNQMQTLYYGVWY